MKKKSLKFALLLIFIISISTGLLLLIPGTETLVLKITMILGFVLTWLVGMPLSLVLAFGSTTLD